jgi:hypothetical protein
MNFVEVLKEIWPAIFVAVVLWGTVAVYLYSLRKETQGGNYVR